ncbi:hypothetical protein AD949_01810 [Acetobacter orleanensis]|uniref:Uncharacterized protein n=1 Tax=Acetobacter orleanensis TaxID=104099 RepID=A0A4Y3TRJ1_9PROT|nr:hypothetical protein AD949_01810 [Acetobacter orleanensis]PCD78675.1 hypothetical protein CO710_10755 [Acetobacter orleanensis]GAN69670.1 hypothetical protein Abol_050_003 [Acetobacter orleanensis JCM 7639]GEB83395.1 hypothetical protein AOR01nite_18720 [Acetobacter orleanensis]
MKELQTGTTAAGFMPQAPDKRCDVLLVAIKIMVKWRSRWFKALEGENAKLRRFLTESATGVSQPDS